VVDAILLVMGARAQPDLVRTGTDSAVIEAVFELEPDSPAAVVLEEAGHPAPEGVLVIKREISRAGRHRVFVNDSPATVALLERLGETLVELHGQHEHQRLMEASRQLDLLDRYAGTEEARARVGGLVGEWEAARDELRRIRGEAREGQRQEDLLRFQLSEIDAVRLREGEEEELRAERRRLQHAERIAAGLVEVTALLYDDERSAAARLRRAGTLLRELAGYDPELGAPAEALGEAEAYLEEAIGRARAMRDRAPFEPDRLAEIDERLDAITRLKRKYGETAEAVGGYRAQIAATLDRLERHDEVVTDLEGRLARAEEAAGQAALQLADARTTAAGRLERQVQKELRGLGMEHARFRIGLRRESAGEGDLAAGPVRWRVGRRGVDQVEMAFSANPGEDLRLAREGRVRRRALPHDAGRARGALRRGRGAHDGVRRGGRGHRGARGRGGWAEARPDRGRPPGALRHPPRADRRLRRPPSAGGEDREPDRHPDDGDGARRRRPRRGASPYARGRARHRSHPPGRAGAAPCGAPGRAARGIV
jgi:DNA repair protein RecN (Recombination protein N)